MLMPPAEQAAHLKAAPASNGSAGLVNGSQATTPKEQRENNRDEVVKQHSMPVTGMVIVEIYVHLLYLLILVLSA